jgi:hypothetical protein
MLLGTRINLHGWVIFRISNRKRAAYIYRRSGVLDDMAFALFVVAAPHRTAGKITAIASGAKEQK